MFLPTQISMILCLKSIAPRQNANVPRDLFAPNHAFPLLAVHPRLLDLVAPRVAAAFAKNYRVLLADLFHQQCCDVEVIEPFAGLLTALGAKLNSSLSSSISTSVSSCGHDSYSCMSAASFRTTAIFFLRFPSALLTERWSSTEALCFNSTPNSLWATPFCRSGESSFTFRALDP